MISVIVKGAKLSPHAPKRYSERPRESIVPTGTLNRPQIYLFFPRKGAEVPDLNALELSKTWGFSGQNKYIYGRFGGFL